MSSFIDKLPASAEVSFAGWTRSVAARILAGSGSAALLAYQTNPVAGCDFVAHGLSDNAELVVVCCPPADDPLAALPRHQPIRVRLDVVKEAPIAEVSIVSATLHLLGILHWLDDEEQVDWALSERVPPRLAALALQPNAMMGVISTERVLLHDATGVTPMPYDEVICWEGEDWPIFPLPDDEFDAHHIVANRPPEGLHALVDAVDQDVLPGWSVARKAEGVGCPHTWDRVFCVDVDRHGVLLMRVTAQGTQTCFLGFGEEITSCGLLANYLNDAEESSAPMRHPRI